MLTPPLPHVCFFHFSDTSSLGSNGSTKILVFDSFLEDRPSTGSRMLWPHLLNCLPYIIWIDYWCRWWITSTWKSSSKWFLISKQVCVMWGSLFILGKSSLGSYPGRVLAKGIWGKNGINQCWCVRTGAWTGYRSPQWCRGCHVGCDWWSQGASCWCQATPPSSLSITAPSFCHINHASFCPCILSTPCHDLLILYICSVLASDLGWGMGCQLAQAL